MPALVEGKNKERRALFYLCACERETGACGDAPGREGQFDKHRDEVQVQADVEADD